jgi:hypothetical protein
MARTHVLGTRYRKVQLGLTPIPYLSGKTQELKLPDGLVQKQLILRLTGSLVIATANATVFSEAPLGLIQRIELIGDGRRILCSCDGRDLWNLARYMHRKKPELAPPLGTIGTRAFSATIPLDAEAFDFRDKSESMLDSRLFKNLILRVTWGAAADIATAGGGGTIAIDSATQLDVLALETAEGLHKILFDHILSTVEIDVTSTNPKLKIDEIPQSGLLAGLQIRQTRDAGAGAGPVPVDDIINDLTIKSDVTIAHVDKIKWKTLQGLNVLDYVLDGGDATTGHITGYAYLRMHENHMFSSALNINALNRAILEASVTRTSGTEKVHVLYDFFEPRENLGQEVTAA